MDTYCETIQQLSAGQVVQDLSDRLTEIVAAVQETRKVGEITLKLTIKPNGESGVMVAEKISAKIPDRPRGDTLFFVSAAGHLMRNDPRQETLPLRQVARDYSQPLRQVVTEAEVVGG